MRLQELADKVGGQLEENADTDIVGLASLEDAEAGDITFLASAKYAHAMAKTRASAVMVAPDWQGTCQATILRVANPSAAFSIVAKLLTPPPPQFAPGIHPTAVVATDVTLAADASIGPYCVIESGACIGAGTVLVASCYVGHDVRIGEHCRIYPFVSLRERTRLGNRVLIHAGAVLGSDGFGYSQENGKWIKVPQVGSVEVGDDVEIGANTTIDRARFGKTIIENGVKLDNLVQVAHNVRIGANTALASQVGLAGSARIGSGVQMAGQVGVVGHVRVGDGVLVGGQAGITKDVEAGAFVVGYPARPFKEARQSEALVHRLPKLKARLEALEKAVQALTSETKPSHEEPT